MHLGLVSGTELASLQRLEMSPQQLQRCPSEPGPLILPVLGPATPEPRSRRRGGSAYGAAVLGSQPHEGFVPGEARACGGWTESQLISGAAMGDAQQLILRVKCPEMVFMAVMLIMMQQVPLQLAMHQM